MLEVVRSNLDGFLKFFCFSLDRISGLKPTVTEMSAESLCSGGRWVGLQAQQQLS